ncbi:hemolysin family protein [Hoyosella subflava]|uniref:Putative membrane protein containing CBS domain protein n=1 Tax=Hoyosella subflava (strain DSM 45089 / JCM 17490 / NBRC 109087 / DQS3-9A1) TaxID=443218 RepID=F6EHD9_HOYSD|nr:hemolysin family protein [Hoyosella subflava]AEF41118.1 Putative membrane protein containing CBS domain protein [Hoyosella subflava DQS3-9A1]
MINVTGMIVGILLLFGNAFFVGAEFALVSTRRTKIEPRAEEGSGAARITLRALDNVSLMMAGAQFGITLCSLGLGAVAEPAVAYALEVPLEALGVPSVMLHPIAVAIALTIVLSLHMTIGEMVPKNLAIAGPERTALVLGPMLYLLVQVLKPLLLLVNWLANTVLRILRVEPKDKVATAFTADEVAGFVRQSKAEGLLDEEEHRLLTGALTMSRETLQSIMVPRDRVVSLDDTATIAQAHAACIRTGFSRFPIVAAGGDFTGYVHVKDLLGEAVSPDDAIAGMPIRTLPRFTSNTLLDDALEGMQTRGSHVAIVTDEEGHALGAAMLEDVVERLIGEIADSAQAAARRRKPQ